MTFSVFLAVLLYLAPTLSREISNEEKENGRMKFFVTHYEECKHLISEENYEMLLDGIYIRNDETRYYIVCVFKAWEWMVNSEINAEKIIRDIQEILERKFTLHESAALTMICNLCKREAELQETDVPRVGRFLDCAVDRIQNDM
ncbi:uncharacterized protein [Chelonus insularis]|uniref:uncharacterized protein n=1 Tax=Chelonus insularis TaxID=460826 RepID=UPI00158E744B|nr:uncharacterized protein LOC118073331 [Chelonus insularis]